MTGPSPVHDLSKLRIDRDPPPAVRRAFGRTLAIVAVLGVLIGAALLWLRGRSGVAVETVVATPVSSGGGGTGGGGATAVTANGYVVARTRASVSAKIPGRLASLTVDGGSKVRKGEVIARLENADYAAAVSEAEANLASARAQLTEAVADRDQSARESRRVAQIHGQSPELVSAQEVETARSSRRSGRGARRFRGGAGPGGSGSASLRARQRSKTPTSAPRSPARCSGRRRRSARWWRRRSAAGSPAARS